MARSLVQQHGLYAYSIHGRDTVDVLDYRAFFSDLAGFDPQLRQTGVGDLTVAITATIPANDRWSVRFVSGIQGLPPLLYDPDTGTESTTDIGGRILATATWVFVDPQERFAVIDQHRPGVPVAVIARALAHLGRELELAPGLTLSLNPVPSPSFVEELDRFDRVRQAAVVIERPNYNWLDSATDLTGYAAESDAGTVELQMSAERGQSLATDSGIVDDIRTLASQSIGPLRNLRVIGRRQGESKETSLSLARHQEKRFVPVDSSGGSAVERDQLQAAASAFLDELPSQDSSDSSS
jgi:hypothetical protein